LHVLELNSGKLRFNIDAHEDRVSFVAWSPTAPIIATGSAFQSGQIRLWHADSGQPAGTLDGHTAWIAKLVFSRDGMFLYSSSADQTIRIWDVNERRCLAVLRGSTDEVFILALSPDGKTLVSGSKDGVVAFWNAAPDLRETQPTLLDLEFPWSFSFDPRGKVMAAVNKGKVAQYDLSNFEITREIPGLGDDVFTVAYSHDGTLLSSGCSNGVVRVWCSDRQRVIQELHGHSTPVFVSFPPGAARLYSRDLNNTVIEWEPREGRLVRRLEPGISGLAESMAISPDGSMIVMGDSKGSVRWFEADSPQLPAVTPGHKHAVRGLAFSADGTKLYSGATDGTVVVWDRSTRTRSFSFAANRHAVHGLTISPDGTRLVSGGTTGDSVKLWDLSTYREVLTLTGQRSIFSRLSFCPSGNWLAVCNEFGQLHLWRAPALEEIAEP
jgi:WD40 repeat protein